MKKIFLSFLLVMAGISHTLAQGLDGNVEQRLKDFFTRYETSYANIGKCKLDCYEVNHDFFCHDLLHNSLIYTYLCWHKMFRTG